MTAPVVAGHAVMQVAQKAFIVDGSYVLMVRYGVTGEHDWDLPGGRLDDADDDLDAALEREVREETGLTARAGRPLAVFLATHSATRCRALFIIREVAAAGVLTMAGQVPEDDIADLCWVSLDAVPALKLNPCVAPQLVALVRAAVPVTEEEPRTVTRAEPCTTIVALKQHLSSDLGVNPPASETGWPGRRGSTLCPVGPVAIDQDRVDWFAADGRIRQGIVIADLPLCKLCERSAAVPVTEEEPRDGRGREHTTVGATPVGR